MNRQRDFFLLLNQNKYKPTTLVFTVNTATAPGRLKKHKQKNNTRTCTCQISSSKVRFVISKSIRTFIYVASCLRIWRICTRREEDAHCVSLNLSECQLMSEILLYMHYMYEKSLAILIIHN